MRINIIPVAMLADAHLVAEYREIKMLPKCLVRTLKSKKGLDKSLIPLSYTLNKGHGYFFYDKLKYIEDRFYALVSEMQQRGFETKFDSLYDADYDYSVLAEDAGLFNFWKPSSAEMNINIERIVLRIREMVVEKQKPSFYRLRGSVKSISEWVRFYSLDISQGNCF